MLCLALQRVTIIVSEGERSFYHSVQNAAAPAHEALMLHAAAADDNSEEAGPSSPRESSPLFASHLLGSKMFRHGNNQIQDCYG